MDSVDCIIAGGGAIGLAIARALALGGREVLVIERNGDIGLETSARNSEVIHAGIYYPPGSLKALLCRTGREMLVDYLEDNHVPHRLCGKLIVAATPAQSDALAAIETRARANGVTSLQHLDRRDIEALEPELAATSGLFSPATGIFDSRAYMAALAKDITGAGGAIVTHTHVQSVHRGQDGWEVETADAGGERYVLACRTFINAAGLWATDLAHSVTVASPWQVPETYFARGTYYQASGNAPFCHLVYPVPEPGGLGIHLTLDMAGSMRFGPDVEWIDRVDYTLNDTHAARFRSAIARYWPGIADREITPAYCGVRPKLVTRGQPDADFVIAGPETHGLPGLVHLFGIESPGLTASLAIAGHVAALVEKA